MHQRHWMHLDVVAHHELHARQPHPVGRHAPPAEGGGRVGEVEHHLGARGRHVRQVEGLGLDLGDALIDRAGIALGAGDGDVLLVVQHVGGVAGANNCRQAQLAADDGGMRGAAAMIGDDRRRPLHDRHPVGVGVAGDQDGAVHEAVDIVRVLDKAHPPGHRRLADGKAGGQGAPLAGDAVGAQGPGVAARLHRLGACLDDEKIAVAAVARPFHVHGAAVMGLDGTGPAGEGENLRIRQHEAGALGPRGRHGARGAAFAGGVDHFDRLAAAPLLHDGHQRGVGQQRLEHDVFVGIHRALHHGFAQAPGGVDHHHAVEPGLGVDGEHHAGGAEVGAHHGLDTHRQRHLQVVEAARLAVADRPVGEKRGEATAAGVEQGVGTADVQERLLLAGEAGIRQVLGRGAGAYGDVGLFVAEPGA